MLRNASPYTCAQPVAMASLGPTIAQPMATGSLGPTLAQPVAASSLGTMNFVGGPIQAYSVGQDVEMFSARLNCWLPAKVVAVRPDGQIDVEAKIHKSFRASETSQLRIPPSKFNGAPTTGLQASSLPRSNQITIMWQKGQMIMNGEYNPLKISLDWKVRDLVDNTGGMPYISTYPNGRPRGGIRLDGPSTSLSLLDPANLEKPLSVLNLSEGCELSLVYGNR